MYFSTQLLEEVVAANKALASSGLAPLTWGNASGYDHVRGFVAIKPSGVPYDELTTENMVIVDLNGKKVDGDLKPSMDLKTHLEIYKAFPHVRGVVHTHSKYATTFAQAGQALECYGTTHADYFNGTVPCVPSPSVDVVNEDYELGTGCAIVSYFQFHDIDPKQVPAALVKHHGPFAWGKTPMDAYQNALVLELCAEMGVNSLALQPDLEPIPAYLLKKHQTRKHGPSAYYGQK